MLKNYFNKESQLAYKLLWIFLWLSIGSYPIKKNFFHDNFSLGEILLQLRLYAPLIIFTLIVILYVLSTGVAIIAKSNFCLLKILLVSVVMKEE